MHLFHQLILVVEDVLRPRVVFRNDAVIEYSLWPVLVETLPIVFGDAPVEHSLLCKQQQFIAYAAKPRLGTEFFQSTNILIPIHDRHV